ncbi:MAG: hypothetical protein LBD23_14805 [Oscillospiraceae bacterium]|jgi:hypothetical protein|nr:hypothetical protein [Oscillospiraceae bacterium]
MLKYSKILKSYRMENKSEKENCDFFTQQARSKRDKRNTKECAWLKVQEEEERMQEENERKEKLKMWMNSRFNFEN